MTQLDSNAVSQPEPCNSCSVSMQALNILAMSLHTTLQAAQYIRVPLPQASALPFRAVPSNQLPQELWDVCERLGYQLSSVEPVAHAERMADNAAPEDKDPGSAMPASTKLERELGVGATPPVELSSPPSSQSTAVESPIQDDRWYVVFIGRDPGIFAGLHNVMQNVSGIPGGQYRRQPTQQVAQAVYEEALDNGQVVCVTYELSRETLSR